MVQRYGVQSGGNQSSAAKIALAERARRVLELRKEGLTFNEIARRVGYKNATSAYYAFKTALRATIQQPADEVRRLEVERLDALLAAVWSTAMDGRLVAIDRVILIMDRRAKLLGLDAPQKVDHEHRIRMLAAANGFDPDEAVEEARRVLRDARG
jgi:AraC-like DNA-binding protein